MNNSRIRIYDGKPNGTFELKGGWCRIFLGLLILELFLDFYDTDIFSQSYPNILILMCNFDLIDDEYFKRLCGNSDCKTK